MNATPPTMAQGRSPTSRAMREARAKLAEAGVRYVLSCWVDLLGAAEDQTGAAQRLREPVHGEGSAVRGALGLVRAGAWGRPTPTRSRFRIWTAWSSAPGTGPARGCSRICGGRTRRTTCVPARRSSACGAQYGGFEGVRRVRGHRAGVHGHALARRPAGQGVRRRSAAGRRGAAAAPGVRLRPRVLHRLHGVSRRSSSTSSRSWAGG